MSDEATTYKKRLRQYERRVEMTVWVGAGLAGLLAITTGDAFDGTAPAWLKAVEITLIIIGGTVFGLARVKFEWAATLIRRKLDDEQVRERDELSPEEMKWPRGAERYWNASLLVLIIAGLGMALCFWWPVITQGQNPSMKKYLKGADFLTPSAPTTSRSTRSRCRSPLRSGACRPCGAGRRGR